MKEKKEKDSKKREKGLHAYYIELESPLDIARHASFENYSGWYLMAIKDGKKYRLLSTGEHIENLRIIYYATVDKISNFFVYTPGSEVQEKYEIKEKISSELQDFKTHKAPIIELLSNPYKTSTDLKKAGLILKLEVKDPNSLVKSLLNKMHDEQYVPKLYSFFKGKDHIIGTFELFHESGARVFTYAKIEIKEKFSGLSYNYTSDTIEPVHSFSEKSTIYTRIINLSKPFPFF